MSARAVRHYHANGVLTEPARLVSGYRDYGAAGGLRLLDTMGPAQRRCLELAALAERNRS